MGQSGMEKTSRDKSYPFDVIEAKWQAYWLQNKTFRTPDPGDPGSDNQHHGPGLLPVDAMDIPEII